MPDLETKSAFPPRPGAPIASVAGDTAGQAALEEVAREMATAESEGRVVKRLPLDKVEMHHLCRDRMVTDREDLDLLKASIADRGQQAPIEVVRLSGGKFGLIAGLRRMVALQELGAPHVLALIRQPENAAAAYQAMVEENEIRADLSFYERANLVVRTIGQGVFESPRPAVQVLFSHVTPAKRSKILSFVTLRQKLGATLAFPTAIPEKLGLALVAAMEADEGLAGRISAALKAAAPADAQAERRVLDRMLGKPAPARMAEEIAPGLQIETRKGRVVLSGPGVDAGFQAALRDWAVSHAKKTQP